MIADTVIVVLVYIIPAQQPKQNTQNRFIETFEQADKEFDKKYKLDIEELKRAAHEAAVQADEKKKAQRERVMKPIVDIKTLFP